MEWLGEKFLDLTCTINGNLIFIRQFFHTEDSDDILKIFVALKNFLYLSGNFIMFFTDDIRFKNS